MFDFISSKLQKVISPLFGQKNLTEENVKAAVSQVRLALLDADVNYSVIKTFIQRVKEKALGEAVIKSVKSGEQFIKLVHDELQTLMGSELKEINLSKTPTRIMVCGLQGSGKTTFVAKLAYFLKNDKKISNL